MTHQSIRTSRQIAQLLVVTTLLTGCSIYDYAHSKITLFDKDRVAENFRHMDRVFPSRVIAPSSAPLLLKVAHEPINSTYEYQGQQHNLSEFLQRSQTTGFLVIHNDTIIHEQYFSGYGERDKVTSFSVAKSFIATLVGIALDEGRIRSVEDPVTDYVTKLKGTGFDNVPIADILQMASGIDFSEKYDDKSTDAFTIYNDLYLFMRPIAKVIADYGRSAPSGSRFHYASINTQALALLLQAVYDKSVSELMQEKLWQPMGAADGAYWLTDQHDNEVGFWGLNATLRDFSKLGLLYLNQGTLNGHQIVSSDWVNKATSPDKAFLQPGQIDDDWGYQYHWWVPRQSEGDYSAIGIWGQFIYVNPAARIVIVKTSADQNFKAHEFEAISAFRSIAKGFQAPRQKK